MGARCRGLALLIPLLLGVCLPAGAAPAPESFASLASRARLSVVNVSTTRVVKGGGFHGGPMGPGQRDPREFFGEEFFRRFFGDQPREFKTPSLGSGFILDTDGHILTNAHVIENAEEVLVKLSDEHEFKAKVIGTDARTDIALIKVEAEGVKLTPAELGDSDEIKVGDWVLAVGNPFGYSHTVTAGIISAKERVIGSGPYDSFLQTDAAINPGNSGGPLFDLRGKVVGINTAIVAGGTGIGFAIPVNLAKDVLSQLSKEGKVTRGWLGVAIQEITRDLARSFGLPEAKGALVSDVAKDGPAAKAGLKRGDVILEFDGSPVNKMHELPLMVARRAPGKTVQLKVHREGKAQTVSVKLGELKEEKEVVAEAEPGEELGLAVQEITPELRKRLDLEADSGVIVTGVAPGSFAAQGGLQRGDIIQEVNQQPVSDLSSYRKALAASAGKESALFLVKRGAGTLYIVVPLPKKK
ncbi:MAG: DegQ family serine endoprotease [Deltaproteobacteria bacterium]|nr:DegQ family serine endoprotease [Deltaproteobacteria bacterium]